MLTFKPQIISRKLVAGLKDRTRDVVLQRFGIGGSPERKTLEAIGNKYGITRERVRQIEAFALNAIRKSENFASARDAFEEIDAAIGRKGWLVSEREILEHLGGGKAENHAHFLLVLGEPFVKIREDEEFHHRWTVDEDRSGMIHDILKRLHGSIGEDELISEEEIISRIQKYSTEAIKEKISEEIVRSWLNLSKLIGKNTLGEWGPVSSPAVRPRGMRDLALLVLKRQGSPMHFNEVAEMISKIFPKSAHPATVHNELIKDERFVLVGRGLYALGEWGYSAGTVKDVIKNVLKSSKPLSKDEINKCVLKERHVKENTILVNLQNRRYFKKTADGRYTIA